MDKELYSFHDRALKMKKANRYRDSRTFTELSGRLSELWNKRVEHLSKHRDQIVDTKLWVPAQVEVCRSRSTTHRSEFLILLQMTNWERQTHARFLHLGSQGLPVKVSNYRVMTEGGKFERGHILLPKSLEEYEIILPDQEQELRHAFCILPNNGMSSFGLCRDHQIAETMLGCPPLGPTQRAFSTLK